MNDDPRNPYSPTGPDPAPEEGGDFAMDAELIRYLDDELDPPARARLETRLAAEPGAARRLETLRRRSAAWSAVLADLDPADARVREHAAALRSAVGGASDAAPARGARALEAAGAPRRVLRIPGAWLGLPVSLRAAALVALILAGALAVPPARAWMADRVRDAAEALGLTSAPAPLPPDAVPADADITVAFAVRAETFEVHVPRPAGLLVVRRGDGDAGSAEAIGTPDGPGAAGVAFVVLPSGLRIDGATRADATYTVTLPATVRAVRVRAGDAPAVVRPLPGEGETLRIRLDRP